jgi:hypothetical protein
MTLDLFISHASEDKDAIARPLAEELRSRGLTLWFDEAELTIGDNLTETIDRGLAEAKFGVVILSPRFFAKDWPRRELDGLTARELDGGHKKVILPIWHEVNYETVLRFSPPLAGRVAARSTAGVVLIADQIERVLRGTSIDDAIRDAPPPSPAAPKRFPRRLGAWLRALQLGRGSAAALVVVAVLAGVGGYALFAGERPQPAPRAASGDQFDAQLDQTLAPLDARRLSAGKQMRAAKTAKGQAAAAARIASAYRKAARDVSRLTPPVDSRRQATVLHDELVVAGRTFEQLASAARAGSRRAYDDRRSTIKAREAAINRVLESLSTRS